MSKLKRQKEKGIDEAMGEEGEKTQREMKANDVEVNALRQQLVKCKDAHEKIK